MLKELVKQSFLASLAASLSGLIIFYIIGFWFISDNRLNILEFFGLTFFIMPLFISIFLVVFSFRFLSDFYKEHQTISWWKTSSLLFVFTFICLIILDQGAFLITDDIPKAVLRAFRAIDKDQAEKGLETTTQVMAENGENISDIGGYAPWILNWMTLFIFLAITSLLAHFILRRTTKPKESNYR